MSIISSSEKQTDHLELQNTNPKQKNEVQDPIQKKVQEAFADLQPNHTPEENFRIAFKDFENSFAYRLRHGRD